MSSDGWVRIRVQGVETINRILGSLSNHEEIFWIIDPRLEQAEIPANKVELPPQEIVDAIKESCWQLKLELTVVGSDMQE
ncbi:MAG: hypothetical protein JXB07_06920 [Anaerolineae bacterium]|nr:hypothetical protein [Anaerolineae bacterium]